LGTCLEEVCFVEAVKCRPDRRLRWSPNARMRIKCMRFLREQVSAIRPQVILPLGAKATRSCLDIAGQQMKGGISAVAGTILRWIAPWVDCVILPLYHPSPANCSRWMTNKSILRKFRRQQHHGASTTRVR